MVFYYIDLNNGTCAENKNLVNNSDQAFVLQKSNIKILGKTIHRCLGFCQAEPGLFVRQRLRECWLLQGWAYDGGRLWLGLQEQGARYDEHRRIPWQPLPLGHGRGHGPD